MSVVTEMPTAEIPRRVPVLIEYRKRERMARSVCFVIGVEDGQIIAAGTLDGRQPMGIVTIDARDVVRWSRLEESRGGGQ